jgi:hypothetical protein
MTRADLTRTADGPGAVPVGERDVRELCGLRHAAHAWRRLRAGAVHSRDGRCRVAGIAYDLRSRTGHRRPRSSKRDAAAGDCPPDIGPA